MLLLEGDTLRSDKEYEVENYLNLISHLFYTNEDEVITLFKNVEILLDHCTYKVTKDEIGDIGLMVLAKLTLETNNLLLNKRDVLARYIEEVNPNRKEIIELTSLLNGELTTLVSWLLHLGLDKVPDRGAPYITRGEHLRDHYKLDIPDDILHGLVFNYYDRAVTSLDEMVLRIRNRDLYNSSNWKYDPTVDTIANDVDKLLYLLGRVTPTQYDITFVLIDTVDRVENFKGPFDLELYSGIDLGAPIRIDDKSDYMAKYNHMVLSITKEYEFSDNLTNFKLYALMRINEHFSISSSEIDLVKYISL